ncbi:MAG: putative toxin-antitoxin system toxin component, PIN family [Candidatus Altiarchaeota archaeon]
MKVVLDTNIFISAIFWGGIPEKILEYLSGGRFTLVSSDEILDELTDVLTEYDMPVADVLVWRRYLLANSMLVKPTAKIEVCTDKKDDKFIEAANAANADYIVSGDKHLLRLKEHQQTKILTAREFLKLLD